MHIENYTFEEFKNLAAQFHGYPAPGLLVGGYMVSMAKKALPPDTLFEALVETNKCLPDAVQMLTLCSVGNNWMKIINLGKYAVSLYDKYTGMGYRVHLDVDKMGNFPEMYSWFLKKKPKKEQDTEQLFQEIRTAGENICSIQPVTVHPRLLRHANMGAIGICPRCKEAYPQKDGALCRGCMGEAPYSTSLATAPQPHLHIVTAEEAVGKKALHDMTQIIPGEYKGAAFSAGQTLSAGDVCRLQQMGRFSLAVEDDTAQTDMIHENSAAEIMAQRMAGKNIAWQLPPKEGKIAFTAKEKGLLCIDTQRMKAFNTIPEVMLASRQDASLVNAGTDVAATRIIPLFIPQVALADALGCLDTPLFSVLPLRQAKVGILITGTEVFKGLIQDKFAPIISAKVAQYGCTIAATHIVPDEKEELAKGIAAIQAAGADLLITTGGMSVDPDDITRAALLDAGLTHMLHGMPVLPGSMSLTGRLPAPDGSSPQEVFAEDAVLPIWQPSDGAMQVIGVPACALYYKTTAFDILLQRFLAGRIITRAELASLGEGGLCMNCKVCTWPKCFFLK